MHHPLTDRQTLESLLFGLEVLAELCSKCPAECQHYVTGGDKSAATKQYQQCAPTQQVG